MHQKCVDIQINDLSFFFLKMNFLFRRLTLSVGDRGGKLESIKREDLRILGVVCN